MLILSICESFALREENLPLSLVSRHRSGPSHHPPPRPILELNKKDESEDCVYSAAKLFSGLKSGQLGFKKKKKKEIQQWLFSSQKISVFLTGSQVLEPTEGLTVTFLSLSLLNTSPPRFIYKRVPYLLQKI